MNPDLGGQAPLVDTSSRDEFVDYYAEASLSQATMDRYRNIQDVVLRSLPAGRAAQHLDVVDIGCGAGTQAVLWAEQGHLVCGIDVSERLIELARTRAAEKGLDISYCTGTAAALPWADGSADVCILPELLEHVPEWEACLAEAARIVRPGGVLFLTTTNWLCPVQQEFNLPLYSWYPGPLKRHFEKLSKTTRPELANFATYPAVNWFSFFQLRAVLMRKGFRCLDKFQTAPSNEAGAKGLVFGLLRKAPPLRWLAHCATSYTQVLAIKTLSSKS